MQRRFGSVGLCAGLLSFILPPLLFAQASAELTESQRSLESALQATGGAVSIDSASSGAIREYQVHWRSSQAIASSSTAGQELQIVGRIDQGESPTRQRSSELSKGQVVVVVRDRHGVIRHSQVIADPRLIISEFPDEHGVLHRDDFYRTDVTFSVLVPSSIEVGAIDVLRPDWDSSGALHLSRVATVATPTEAK